MEEIGKQIKERRKMLRITQRDLADLVGMSVNTLNKIEQGKSNPRLQNVLKIVEAVGLELTTIVKGMKL